MIAGRWQPIDAAPDDREILVYVPTWGAVIARFDAEFNEWTSRMQCPVSLTEEADRPTHWMPLPDPPEGAAAGAVADLDGSDASATEPVPTAATTP